MDYSFKKLQSIDCIDSNIDPIKFFEKYVNKRLPVKFNNIMNSFERIQKWKNNKYLIEKAGDCLVRVEYRQNHTQRFGIGQEIQMEFKEFLDHIENDAICNYYLTTQELEYSLEGKPNLISPPLTNLKDDFNMLPDLTGHLIVQNLNLWYGKSDDSRSSSGLHHDFHDNLYILIKGEKTFRLFHPMEYVNLYPVGEIECIHSNGRINYQGQPTLADGSDKSSQAAVMASKALEIAASKLLRAEENHEDTKMLSEIDDEIEAALEAALDAEVADNECDSEDNDNECDQDDLDEEFGEDEAEDEAEVDSDLTIDLNIDNTPLNEIKRKFTGDDETSNKRQSKSEPSNFSRVDTSLPLEVLTREYPLYVDALSRSVEVTIKAGEMLYLPAGWYHEVFSQSQKKAMIDSKDNEDKSLDDCEDCNIGHLALNYWFHPPDNDVFDKPYQSDFWLNDWRSRSIETLTAEINR